LCGLHAEIETVTLRDQKRVYKSGTVDERILALERVAELTRTHTNVATVNVARFLAEALVDDSLAVRRAAVRLLSEGQNADEASRGMVRGLDKARRTWAEIEARVVELPGEPRGNRGSVALTIDELTDVPEYFQSVLTALGRLRDERSLQALLSYLRSPLDRTPGRFLAAASEAALQLDTRRGVESVITLLGNIEEALAQGAIPRRFPHAVGKTTLLDAMKEPLENADDDDYAQIIAALSRYANRKQLPQPAPAIAHRSVEWRSWYEGVRETLPDRVAP
jgi:hypothetical protein